LKHLANHVIENFYSEFTGKTDACELMLNEVITRTARLMAQWQSVGFCHGVMNTDNMSILGLTLDYGPFGFMEAFNPAHICNHSDEQGRYSYENQPYIGLWNCSRLAQALTPLISAEQCNAALARYESVYLDTYNGLMRAKLGLTQAPEDDTSLIADLLALLATQRIDFTLFFRKLSQSIEAARDLALDLAAFDAWATRYRTRLAAENCNNSEREARMKRVNPKFVLRNHLAQIAIEKAAQKDFSEVNRLLGVLQQPFDEQPENEAYAAAPPDWARDISVSCSS
jgi:uncharacterized protein YdiU (UPF0061 family)